MSKIIWEEMIAERKAAFIARKANEAVTKQAIDDLAAQGHTFAIVAKERSKIIEFPKQLELPLVWWAEPKIWRERYLVTTDQRPTEDAALENIYNQAQAKSGKLGAKVGGIEKRVYMLELRSFRECPRWYNEAERHQWVARQSGLFVSDIEDILETIDIVMFQEEIIAELEAKEKAAQGIAISKTVFASIVKEVMQEEKAA